LVVAVLDAFAAVAKQSAATSLPNQSQELLPQSGREYPLFTTEVVIASRMVTPAKRDINLEVSQKVQTTRKRGSVVDTIGSSEIKKKNPVVV
jgi:hypothetical protein